MDGTIDEDDDGRPTTTDDDSILPALLIVSVLPDCSFFGSCRAPAAASSSVNSGREDDFSVSPSPAFVGCVLLDPRCTSADRPTATAATGGSGVAALTKSLMQTLCLHQHCQAVSCLRSLPSLRPLAITHRWERRSAVELQ